MRDSSTLIAVSIKELGVLFVGVLRPYNKGPTISGLAARAAVSPHEIGTPSRLRCRR